MIYTLAAAEFWYGPGCYPVTPYNLKRLPQSISVNHGEIEPDVIEIFRDRMSRFCGHQLGWGEFKTVDFTNLIEAELYSGPALHASIVGNGWVVRFVRTR